MLHGQLCRASAPVPSTRVRQRRESFCCLLIAPTPCSAPRTVTAQADTMIRLYLPALSLVAAALVACRSAPAPTRAELLEKLHQCRDELSKGRSTGAFVSPCTKLDPSPLDGISRHELVAALGPPSFCVGLTEGGFPSGQDCPPQWDPKWSFYLGGINGPELACVTDEQQRCELVRWLHSDSLRQ
jgi:hypothetical protein